MRDKLAEVIADAMGYDISDMHRDKPHWVETGGMLNGRFRDVNDPRADDFADASAAVREYLGSDEVLEAPDAIESLRAENARLTKQVANLEARGIHSCNDECQRPLCVAQRENARLREAGKEAEWFMAHYAEYIATVPADEIERHPYLPDLQDKIEALRAALKQQPD